MKKRILVSVFFVLGVCALFAQGKKVKANVYPWVESKSSNVNILKGSTTDLASLQVNAVTLRPGQVHGINLMLRDRETLVMVKEGILSTTILNNNKDLGPGSVALILPGDHHSLRNDTKDRVVFFIMTYTSVKPMNLDRGKEAGGSFMIDWNDLTFKPHDKGGIRQYFERPTAMTERFEMHVTTLNPGLKSHEPHTHRAEEIVLMIKGDAEMQIDDKLISAATGSVIFLSSQIPHALKNAGEEPCEYFAFQW